MSSSERFGYEWEKYDYLIDQYEEQFLKWVTPLRPEWFKGKSILDAGCGMGRNSYWPARYGAGRVVAFDRDQRSVEATRRTLKEFHNVDVGQGDIETYDTDERFDLIFSIGVVHHLDRPGVALANLFRLLKPGGKLLIWVYGYEGNEWIVKYVDPVRKNITSKLPIGLTYTLSYLVSVPLYCFVHLIPQRRPYLSQLKTFRFQHVHSIVFDQLLPRVANYWKKSEVEELMRAVPGLSDIQISPVNGMSWTAIGTKS